MKKILLVLVIIATSISIFSSCKDDVQKSYRVTNNHPYITSSIEYANGSLYEVIVFQYRGSDIIFEDNLGTIKYGGESSRIINAKESCDKVRVSFQFIPKDSSGDYSFYSNRFYTEKYFYLEDGKTKEIKIDSTIMITAILK